jgi:hypothetical protein
MNGNSRMSRLKFSRILQLWIIGWDIALESKNENALQRPIHVVCRRTVECDVDTIGTRSTAAKSTGIERLSERELWDGF